MACPTFDQQLVGQDKGEPNDTTFDQQLAGWDKGEPNGTTKPTFYHDRKDNHYAPECPKKEKGKAPTKNMLVAMMAEI